MTVRGQALTVRAFGATHTGRVRAGNEDSFFVGDAAFAVADGMGGHQAGERASAMAVAAIEHFTLNTFRWFFAPDGAGAESGAGQGRRG